MYIVQVYGVRCTMYDVLCTSTSVLLLERDLSGDERYCEAAFVNPTARKLVSCGCGACVYVHVLPRTMHIAGTIIYGVPVLDIRTYQIGASYYNVPGRATRIIMYLAHRT